MNTRVASHGSTFEIDQQVCALLQTERDGDEEDGTDMDSNQKTNPSKGAIWKARSQILLAAVLYGTSFPLTKVIDDHIPLGPSLALRFGLATLVTLPWLWEVPALDWSTSRRATIQGMGVGVWVSIGFLAQAIGIVTTQANKVWNYLENVTMVEHLLDSFAFLTFPKLEAAFFCSLYVVVVPFLDRLIGISLSRNQIIGAFMSVFGVGLLSSSGGSISFESGDVWSLIQPVAFGIGYWRTEHVIGRFPTEVNRIATAELLSCFILALVYAIISCSSSDDVPTTMQLFEWFSNPQIVIALLWCGIITTAFSAYLEAAAMKTISASETTLLISSEPIWACLFAFFLVGEQLDPIGMVGAIFILGACVVSLCSSS
jgi:drug/metabolite transporter (DMT)-like permease